MSTELDSAQVSVVLAGLLGLAGCTSGASGSPSGSASAAYPLRDKGDMSAKEGLYYEIFVRSFADSNGDGIGDLNGVTAKLDYLKNLGVQGIWLTPIYPSPSYHGYDVTDYSSVNPDFGTTADFQNLVAQAHQRGITVILDFVANHTSNQDPWFTDAAANPTSPYRDYYHFVAADDPSVNLHTVAPWGSPVWHPVGDGSYYYYGIFGTSMPDLNYDNPAVRQAMAAAAQQWLKLGADGFRLDSAIYIFANNEPSAGDSDRTTKNLQWWNEFALACESVDPGVYLVGETWNTVQNITQVLPEYSQPFDSTFDFAFEQAALTGVSRGTAMAGTQPLASFFADEFGQRTAVDQAFLNGPFGTNHDMPRLMSALKSADAAKVMANVYLTMPGNPFVYYGEELGMYGPEPDEDIREPFRWTADGSGMDTTWEEDHVNTDVAPLSVQMNDPGSMYSYYAKLIGVRQAHAKLFTEGTFTAVTTDPAVMGYLRQQGSDGIYCFHNFSGQTATVDASTLQLGSVVFSSADADTVAGTTITLAPYSSMFISQSA